MSNKSVRRFRIGDRVIITSSPIKELVGRAGELVEFNLSYCTVRLDAPLLGIGVWNVASDGFKAEQDGNDAKPE